MKKNTELNESGKRPRRTKEERDRQVGINGLAARTPRRAGGRGGKIETVEQFTARGGKVEVLPSVWDRVAA